MLVYATRFHIPIQVGDQNVWSDTLAWCRRVCKTHTPEDTIEDEETWQNRFRAAQGEISLPNAVKVRFLQAERNRILEITHPDRSIPNRVWKRNFCLGFNGKLGMQIWVSDLIEDYSPANARLHPQARQSDLVKDLIDHWGIHPKDPTGKVKEISPSALLDLCREIPNPARDYTIVLLSPTASGNLPTDPEKLAATLAGLGQVWPIRTKAANWQATDVLGREWTPYNGASLLIPPAPAREDGRKDTYDHIRTYRLFPQEINRLIHQFGSIDERLLFLCGTTHNQSRHTEAPTIDSLRREEMAKKISALRERLGQPSPEVEEEITQKLERIQGENSQLQEMAELLLKANTDLEDALKKATESALSQEVALTNAQEEKTQLELEIENLKFRLEQKVNKATKVETEFVPKTWHDILNQLEKELPTQIVLSKNGRKTLLESPFENKMAVWEAFQLLGTTFLKADLGESENVDLPAAAKSIGWDYNPHLSQSATGQFANEYTSTHNGFKGDYNRHLKRGTSHDPRHCFRIHFEFFKSEKAIVIHHAGRHLKNSMS